MNCRQIRERLDDFVDGELSDAEIAHIEEHFSSCTACRRELDALRSLLRRADELPRVIEPPHDLWATIQPRLLSQSAACRFWRRRVFVYPALAGLAAAAILLTVAGPYLLRMAGDTESGGGAKEPAVVNQLTEEVRKADEEYTRAREELMAVLEKRQGDLAPETQRVFEENLAVIDGAVAEIRAALEEDPENARLVHMLAATQSQSLKLMALAVELSAES